MGSSIASKMFIALALSCLILSGFILSDSHSCSVSSKEDAFTGGECTAEAIHAQTLWISQSENQAVLNDKLILVVAVLVTIFLKRLLPMKIDVAKRLWIRAQAVHRERNLFNRKIFLPYLFATHGW